MDQIDIFNNINIANIRLLLVEEPKLLLIFEVLCIHINDRLNNRKHIQLDTLIKKEKEEIQKQKKYIKELKKLKK